MFWEGEKKERKKNWMTTEFVDHRLTKTIQMEEQQNQDPNI